MSLWILLYNLKPTKHDLFRVTVLLTVCMSVCLSVCQYVCLSVCPSVGLARVWLASYKYPIDIPNSL